MSEGMIATEWCNSVDAFPELCCVASNSMDAEKSCADEQEGISTAPDSGARRSSVGASMCFAGMRRGESNMRASSGSPKARGLGQLVGDRQTFHKEQPRKLMRSLRRKLHYRWSSSGSTIWSCKMQR
jgi:hypothetical protein